MRRWLILLAALLLARLAVGQNNEIAVTQALGSSSPRLLASTTVAPEASSPTYTLRASVREVRVDFSVSDSRGRAVAQIAPADVDVFDSGSEVQQIHGFTTESTLPLRVVFLFDSSQSTSPMLPALKTVAPAFLNSIFRPGVDTAMLASFNTKINRIQSFTGNAQQIAKSIDLVQNQGLTSLFDSLIKITEQDLAAESTEPERRIIILLSDGIDNYSLRGINDAARALNSRGIILYSVFLNTRKAQVCGFNNLDTLTELTGGKALYPTKVAEIAPAFAAIEKDLRTQYSFTFRPSSEPDGQFHRIAIKAKAGQSWKIRARAGYVADAASDQTNALVASR